MSCRVILLKDKLVISSLCLETPCGFLPHSTKSRSITKAFKKLYNQEPPPLPLSDLISYSGSFHCSLFLTLANKLLPQGICMCSFLCQEDSSETHGICLLTSIEFFFKVTFSGKPSLLKTGYPAWVKSFPFLCSVSREFSTVLPSHLLISTVVYWFILLTVCLTHAADWSFSRVGIWFVYCCKPALRKMPGT